MASPPSQLLYSRPDEAQGAAALITVENIQKQHTRKLYITKLNMNGFSSELQKEIRLTLKMGCQYVVICIVNLHFSLAWGLIWQLIPYLLYVFVKSAP